MIVLDTDVASEIMKPVPESRVVEWVDSVPAFETAITSLVEHATLDQWSKPWG